MSDLFIVDNGDKNWKAKDYLHEWADIAPSKLLTLGPLSRAHFDLRIREGHLRRTDLESGRGFEVLLDGRRRGSRTL